MDVDSVLDFREIQYAGKVERIVHVQVDVEQGLFRTGIEVVVEFYIVFLFDFFRVFRPQRFDIVYDIVLFGIDIFAVLPFLFFCRKRLLQA